MAAVELTQLLGKLVRKLSIFQTADIPELVVKNEQFT